MKRRPYEDTTVSAQQSQAEIRALLQKYGAAQFGIMEQAGLAIIGFTAHERLIRLEVTLPDRRDGAFTRAGRPLRPGSAAALSVHDQAERRLWRATRAWIFAQLESIESGIRTFEEAFLADTVLPDGQRFSEWAEPQVRHEVQQGRLPARLTLTPEKKP